MSETLAQRIVEATAFNSPSYAAGDQVAPCAVLWTDPDRLWEGVMPELQAMLPELFVLGSTRQKKRSGPALWLRCIEGAWLVVRHLREPRQFFTCPASAARSFGP